jgi:hypothetical protein
VYQAPPGRSSWARVGDEVSRAHPGVHEHPDHLTDSGPVGAAAGETRIIMQSLTTTSSWSRTESRFLGAPSTTHVLQVPHVHLRITLASYVRH